MAKILAIETSTGIVGVALTGGGDILFEKWLLEPMGHSSLLLPMCAEALESAGVKPDYLDAVAVSVGPGSFTGLRIGCATAQGLAHAWRLPVVPVPTFDVLLEQALCEPGAGGTPTHVAIVQGKARAQTVTALYAALAAEDGADKDIVVGRHGTPSNPAVVIPPSAKSIEEFLRDICRVLHGRVAVTGDAAEALVSRWEKECRIDNPGLEVYLVGESFRLPKPSGVAKVAARMFLRGAAVDPKMAVPRYFRRSQAEVVMERKTATS